MYKYVKMGFGLLVGQNENKLSQDLENDDCWFSLLFD